MLSPIMPGREEEDALLRYKCLDKIAKGHAKLNIGDVKRPKEPAFSNISSDLRAKVEHSMRGSGMKKTGFDAHPILSKLPCFDGIDPETTPLNDVSPDADQVFEDLVSELDKDLLLKLSPELRKELLKQLKIQHQKRLQYSKRLFPSCKPPGH